MRLPGRAHKLSRMEKGHLSGSLRCGKRADGKCTVCRPGWGENCRNDYYKTRAGGRV